MPRATHGTIELEYEQLGDPSAEPLLLIMGLGAQLTAWDDSLCDAFVARGFTVVRYDNRDVGRSTHLDDQVVDLEAEIGHFLSGEPINTPYSIEDMADDAAAVLDAVGWDSAHIMGASMGGMIAQSFAIRHPARTRTLISIMSTTGDPDVGQPDPEVAGVLLEPPADGREAVIEASVAVDRVIASPMYFDEELSRAKSAAAYDRAYYPDGILRQLLAILTQRPRSEDLRALDVPALVIHGAKDPLVTPTGGQRTHEVLRGSELIVLPEAGHDMPEVYRPELIDRVTALAMRNVPA